MQPNKTELKAFVEKHRFSTQMRNSTGLDSYSNYIGENSDWLVVPGIGRNRDSEILQESNFEAALERLGGESESIQIKRFGHWGCGWFEQIQIDPKDSKAVRTAFEIYKSLKEYPVLDESDFYERETEYQTDYAEDAADELAEALCLHLGLEGLEDEMRELAVALNIECQRYYGNDSCINISKFREPELTDWERVRTCLKQMYWYESPAFEFMCAAFDIGGES